MEDKYYIRPCVCDWAIVSRNKYGEQKETLVAILDSHRNAEIICKVLNFDYVFHQPVTSNELMIEILAKLLKK